MSDKLPAMRDDFDEAGQSPSKHEIDAANWEPHDEPDTLEYDPPEPVYDSQRVMTPSPLGNIDVSIQREFDPDAQRAIREAQQSTREVDQDFADLRSIDEQPGAGLEYEAHLREQDDYETRMRDRFNHAMERGPTLDR